MKRLPLLLLLLLTVPAYAEWLPPAKYATQYTLYFALEDSNSPHRFFETPPALADVHVFQDGVSEARATNAVTDLGRTFSLILTAAEMTARVVAVDVNDASAPPLFKDAVFYIPTFGHASAYHVFNPEDWTDGGRLDLLLDAVKAMTDLLSVNTTTIAAVTDANEFTITAGEDVNDAYTNMAIMVQDATDSHSEVRWIEEYVTSRSVLVDEPFSFTPAPGDNAWILGPVYGGIIPEILSLLNTSRAPTYYYNTTGRATGGAGHTTYYQQDGTDP